MRSPEIAVELPNGTRMDVPEETTPPELAPIRAAVLSTRDREAEGHAITVRRGVQKDPQTVGMGEFSSALEEEFRTRGIS